MTLVVNGEPQEVDDGATVQDVVALVGARPTGTAVAVNGDVVPRGAWGHRPLHEGDRIEVLTAVQGG